MKTFFNSLNINRKEFLKTTGLGYAFFSQMLTGQSEVTATTADKIAQVYPGFSTGWLLHGMGEMFVDESTKVSGAELAEPLPPYGPKAITLDTLADVIRNLQDQLADHEARLRAAENALAAKNAEKTE